MIRIRGRIVALGQAAGNPLGQFGPKYSFLRLTRRNRKE
jgi:hypothetical protein